jgi:membrane complex biogenesis BtpA family protein
MNVIRNDGSSALAVAYAAGARFIRVNVLCGARVTDQGIIEGIAHNLLRERASLAAAHIAIFADVNVKHSAPLAARPVEDEVQDLLYRGGADALIVSGAATGRPADLSELETVHSAAAGAPVFVGSGVTAETLAALWPYCNGFIVGSALKRDGRADQPVDAQRVRRLMEQWTALQERMSKPE